MSIFGRLISLCIGLVLLAGAAFTARISLSQTREEELNGTQWQLNSYGPPGAEIPLAPGSILTMAFIDGQRVGGTDGCNTFEGRYEVYHGGVVFKNMTSSMEACTDDSLINQESKYLQALSQAHNYRIEGDMLTIWYNHGAATLNFSRTMPPGLIGAELGKG